MISCVCALGSHVASFLQAFWPITWVYYHHVCHMSSASHLPWFGHPNIWCKSTGYETPHFIYSENFCSTWSCCSSQQFAPLHLQLVNFTGQQMKFYTYIWHLVISTIGFRVAEKWNIPYWIPLMQSAVLQCCNFDFLIVFQNTNFATFSYVSVHATNSYGEVMEVSALASLPWRKTPQFPLHRRPHGPQS